jgi:hypothetical protein
MKRKFEMTLPTTLNHTHSYMTRSRAHADNNKLQQHQYEYVVEDDDDDDDYEEEDDDLLLTEEEDESEDDESIKIKICKFIKNNPELTDKWVEVNEEIKKTEPNIIDILKQQITTKDMAKIVQMVEVYYNSARSPDENTLKIRDDINRMIENAKKEYEQISTLDKDIHDKLELMETEFTSYNTHTSYKIKILTLNTNRANKSAIYRRYSEMVDAVNDTDEYFKLKRWVDCALRLPFDNIKTISSTNSSLLLQKTRYMLDKELYGMNDVKEQILLFLNSRIYNPNSKSSLGLIGPPGVGKCLGKDTPILMYDGTIKMVQNIITGDLLMGDDSTKRIVLSTCTGKEQMYRVIQPNGLNYTVNKSHILTLYDVKESKLIDMPILNYLKLSDSLKNNLYGVKTGVNFIKKHVNEYEPYLIGYLSGIGIDRTVKFNFNDSNNNIKNSILSVLELKHVKDDIYRVLNVREPFSFQDRIHPYYLTSSIQERVHFLIGMMDACTSTINTNFKISTYNIDFCNDCLYLARSLGLNATYKIYDKTRVKSKITFHGLIVIDISTNGFEKLLDNPKVLLNYYPIKIEEINVDDYYGFTLNGNSRFLLGDFTITHNTRIARIVADAMDYPFEQISFGGVSGPEFLRGHDYTYIGSKPGMIVESLSRMGVKNGVLFLDELDKATENKDVCATLLHITDPVQNHEFRDRYLSELTIDLSKIWFIYSMNNLPSDLALKDRLHIINIHGYTVKDKVIICNNYLLPKALENINRNPGDIYASTETLYYLINRVCSSYDKGVRNIERVINDICSKIHFLVCNQDENGNLNLGKISFDLGIKMTYPVELTIKMINIFTVQTEVDFAISTLYN